MHPLTGALLTDLYQLNMIQAYLDHGETRPAVFEFFMRKLPARRGFLMAAGLDQALDYLERLRFSGEEIEWLARTGPELAAQNVRRRLKRAYGVH